jgi:hypothetical protein
MPNERTRDLRFQKSELDDLRLKREELVRQISDSRETIRRSQEVLQRIDDMLANAGIKP